MITSIELLDICQKVGPLKGVPTLESQLQLLDDTATCDMRVCCVDAENLVDIEELSLPNIHESTDTAEWCEHIPASAYDSEGDYISYSDLEINNAKLNRCYRYQVPVLEICGYSDYSGNTHDQSNYEVFEEFLIENNLPYWQATGGHGTIALIVNWVALQNEELAEMIASLDDYAALDEGHLLELETKAFDDQVSGYNWDFEKGFEEWFDIEDFDEYTEKFFPLAYGVDNLATEIFLRYDSGYNGGNPYHQFETGGQLYVDVERFMNDIEKEDFDEILNEINEEKRIKEVSTTQLKLEV